jgi:malonyl-CoA decarboxylase
MATSNPLSAVTSVASDARAWLDRLWSSTADRGRPLANVPPATVPPLDWARQLAQALVSERGEASGAAIARELQDALQALSPDDQAAFFEFVAAQFQPDPVALRAAAERYATEPTADGAMLLGRAAEPPRQELLRRMNMSPGGTAALVAMREHVLKLLKAQPGLKPLDSDLLHLLGSWFNRGFLELRRIDWQTPAAVLEKLITYEAVHEIAGWDDLRRRLAGDRRCFAFFHPALPGEPLIFVEVALTQGLASAVQPLLAPCEGDEASARRRGGQADTAIFYSISNCQEGLRGISFGNFLIKQVVEELKAELPTLVQFSTLSPIPGYHGWLVRRLEGSDGAEVFRPEEIATLRAAVGGDPDRTPADLLAAATEGAWWQDPVRAAALLDPLRRLCAVYLTRPNTGLRGSDPVARFHLGNGARFERINPLGNTSARGMKESFGLMANYLYDRNDIEANHEAFVHTGHVARSAVVDALLDAPEPADAPASPRQRPKAKPREPTPPA